MLVLQTGRKRETDFWNVPGYKSGYFCLGIKILCSYTVAEQLTRRAQFPQITLGITSLQHQTGNKTHTLESLPSQCVRPSCSRCSRDTNPVPSGSQSAKTSRSCCRLIVHVRPWSDAGCDVTDGIVAGITMSGQHHRHALDGFLTSQPEIS